MNFGSIIHRYRCRLYLLQYLQRLEQRLPVPQQPQQEVPFEQFGFETADQYHALRNQLKQEILQETQRVQLPFFQQVAQDRFVAAVTKLEAQHPHWKDYFPQEYVQNFYNQVSQNYPPDYLAKVNWEKELSDAYAVKDGPNKDKRIADLEKEIELMKKPAQTKKQEEKEQRKADLKLVPKASQSGTTSKAAEEEKDIFYRQPKKGGFDSLSHDLKKQLFGR